MVTGLAPVVVPALAALSPGPAFAWPFGRTTLTSGCPDCCTLTSGWPVFCTVTFGWASLTVTCGFGVVTVTSGFGWVTVTCGCGCCTVIWDAGCSTPPGGAGCWPSPTQTQPTACIQRRRCRSLAPPPPRRASVGHWRLVEPRLRLLPGRPLNRGTARLPPGH